MTDDSSKSQLARTARLLLDVLPNLGRTVATRMRDMGEEEVTLMQVYVIRQLHQQRMTTSDLAKRRRVSLQSASVLVQGLVEKGWVVRVPDPNDRRQSLLEVTEEGMQRTNAMRELLTSVVMQALEQLTPEEIEAAQIFLPALQRATHDIDNNDPSDLP